MDGGDFTPDYAMFVIRGDVDLVVHKCELLTSFFTTVTRGFGPRAGGFKAWPIPAVGAKPAGRVWECWGPGSCFILALDFEAWAPLLNRLDLKTNVPGLDQVSFDCIHDTLRNGGATTLSRYQSLPKVKRGGRDNGGDSVRLGSQKSDYSCKWYRRGGEASSFEIKCQHDGLRRNVWAATAAYRNEDRPLDQWQYLFDSIVRITTLRVAKTARCSFDQLILDAQNAASDLSRLQAPLALPGHDTDARPAEPGA